MRTSLWASYAVIHRPPRSDRALSSPALANTLAQRKFSVDSKKTATLLLSCRIRARHINQYYAPQRANLKTRFRQSTQFLRGLLSFNDNSRTSRNQPNEIICRLESSSSWIPITITSLSRLLSVIRCSLTFGCFCPTAINGSFRSRVSISNGLPTMPKVLIRARRAYPPNHRAHRCRSLRNCEAPDISRYFASCRAPRLTRQLHLSGRNG